MNHDAVTKVLCVDDDVVTAAALARMLDSAGYTVELHYSGFGLATAMRRFAPDVLVLDAHMPGLDGCAAMRVVSGLADVYGMKLPTTVFYSGLDPETLQDIALAAGADAYVSKSEGASALLAVLDRQRDAKRDAT